MRLPPLRLSLSLSTVAATLFAAPASANTTLDATVTGVTCTVTTPNGASTVACDASNWSVQLLPGWSASMVATIAYSYADDGLALTRPETVLLFPGPGSPRTFTHEWGALSLELNPCLLRPCGDPSVTYNGSIGPLLVWDNATPDSFQGVVTASASAAVSSSSSITFGVNLTIRPQLLTNTVPAIPEPSTWALMLGPLALLAWSRRRAAVALSR